MTAVMEHTLTQVPEGVEMSEWPFMGRPEAEHDARSRARRGTRMSIEIIETGVTYRLRCKECGWTTLKHPETEMPLESVGAGNDAAALHPCNQDDPYSLKWYGKA